MQAEVSALVAGVNSTVGTADIDVSVYTSDGVYVYVSESWIAHTGVSDALGKRLPELNILPPDQLTKYLIEDQEVLTRKALVTSGQYVVSGRPFSAIIIRALVTLEAEYIVVVTTHVDLALIHTDLAISYMNLFAIKARLLAAKLLTLSKGVNRGN